MVTDLTGTAQTVGPDGSLVTCQAASWSAGAVTLKPGDRRSFSTIVPSSFCALGSTGAIFTFVATTTDPAHGSVLATATVALNISLRF